MTRKQAIPTILVLENYGAGVDFETVWGQGHTQAESTSPSAENFTQWAGQCMGKYIMQIQNNPLDKWNWDSIV